eukprot:CAMPEP_0204308612 /NCGR_PEP_ID=MMETSP0469-20131031/613_1 /ASSEMBLY_ACC=CAM_ASM_000384 /TAXON_ID=2969 /ORGANISM="Oxyrrhis marina" /LENGTH=37 /DNA_ID= /DNA_START= /DNA_END= /DNA_ORIENTATION=
MAGSWSLKRKGTNHSGNGIPHDWPKWGQTTAATVSPT